MKESNVQSDLVKHFRSYFPGAVVLVHADRYTAGIPDMSVTFHGHTLWLEIKHVTPDKLLNTTDIQRQTCIDLSIHGDCFFVIYEEYVLHGEITGTRVIILHPTLIDEADWQEKGVSSPGFNHFSVIEVARKVWDE